MKITTDYYMYNVDHRQIPAVNIVFGFTRIILFIQTDLCFRDIYWIPKFIKKDSGFSFLWLIGQIGFIRIQKGGCYNEDNK